MNKIQRTITASLIVLSSSLAYTSIAQAGCGGGNETVTCTEVKTKEKDSTGKIIETKTTTCTRKCG